MRVPGDSGAPVAWAGARSRRPDFAGGADQNTDGGGITLRLGMPSSPAPPWAPREGELSDESLCSF